MATHAAAHHQQMPAEVIVQKQLEAYNARDLETFMDLLSGGKNTLRLLPMVDRCTVAFGPPPFHAADAVPLTPNQHIAHVIDWKAYAHQTYAPPCLQMTA